MKLDAVQQAAQEQFARQSRNYGAGHILADVSDVSAALARVSIPERARVLDVACGAGHTGLHLASLGHEVTLADIAAPMLECVREAGEMRGLKVETRQHAAEDFPHEDASFDLVTVGVGAKLDRLTDGERTSDFGAPPRPEAPLRVAIAIKIKRSTAIARSLRKGVATTSLRAGRVS